MNNKEFLFDFYCSLGSIVHDIYLKLDTNDPEIKKLLRTIGHSSDIIERILKMSYDYQNLTLSINNTIYNLEPRAV